MEGYQLGRGRKQIEEEEEVGWWVGRKVQGLRNIIGRYIIDRGRLRIV